MEFLWQFLLTIVLVIVITRWESIYGLEYHKSTDGQQEKMESWVLQNTSSSYFSLPASTDAAAALPFHQKCSWEESGCYWHQERAPPQSRRQTFYRKQCCPSLPIKWKREIHSHWDDLSYWHLDLDLYIFQSRYKKNVLESRNKCVFCMKNLVKVHFELTF